MKLVRKRKYTGKELMELVEANPNKVIKYKKKYKNDGEVFVMRAQYKGNGEFLVLHNDDSGGIVRMQWENDYGFEKNNIIVDYRDEVLISRFDEKKKDLIESLKNSNIKTAEIIVNTFYRGLAITGNKEAIMEAGFSKEEIERAGNIIIENR